MKRRPLSITLRLALLFAAVAVLAFLAVGAYLYQTLERQMSHRDDLELVSKVTQIRRILAALPSARALSGDAQPLADAMFGHSDFVLRLTAADGAPLLQSAAPSRPLPAPANAVPTQRAPTLADVRDWTPALGSGRMLNAVGLVGHDGGEAVQITLAREQSDRLKILRRYAADLLFAISFGAALATLLGFVIVRLGMRPLRSVVAKADAINTSRLNTRLSVDDAPVELRELGNAFNAMLDRLEDGVQRLSGFAADLAHDMRTPLNTLMVETQVALSRPRCIEEYQALLASNSEEYERLAHMIENTLFLARVDNAGLALQRERLDLGAELQRIHDYFEVLADEAGVTLRVDAPVLTLHADAMLLQRAVSNLLSNAMRHTPRGGAVELSARRTGEGIELVVSNEGSGIAAQDLPHIFERYYRADPARTTSAHSAGLGLAIVRAIMVLHDGQVRVESAPGATTRFFLIFGDTAQRLA